MNNSYRLPRKLLVLRYDDGWGFDFTLIPPVSMMSWRASYKIHKIPSFQVSIVLFGTLLLAASQNFSTMPLFKRPSTPPTPVPETAPPQKRGTIFSSSRAADNAATTAPGTRTTPPNSSQTTGGNPRRGGFFRRRSTGSSDVDSTRHIRRGSVGSSTSSRTAGTGLLAGRSVRGGDRSLKVARNKVTLAEKAEKEADS